ncbi:MAG: hypothetical protein AAF478_02825 [Pseudomonadota bacterium]
MKRNDIIVSLKTNKELKPLAITNTDLIGYWQHVGSNQVFQIASNSFYYIVGDPANIRLAETS